ncbi:MAG: hypothetical protein HC923_10220 [Myxococcales bacterium]|nr:hypothetical protein [Myxococcales bacterium]
MFDVVRGRLSAVLSDSTLNSILDVHVIEKDLDASATELFELAKRHHELRKDLSRLRSQPKTDAIARARSSTEAELARIADAAEAITRELEKLQQKVDETRTLVSGAARDEPSDRSARLQAASREIDLSAAAIRELASMQRSD